MSFRTIVSSPNIVFLLGGVYFAALAGMRESTIYSVIPATLCFVAFGLGIQSEWFLSSPWRTATAVLVVVLLVVQEAANLSVETTSDYYTLSSTLINGIFLVVFLGVLLSTLKSSVSREKEENFAKTPNK
ncbi:MAG: hypothetical protein ACRECH_00475 [Nitrososphaerales archaeon]